ncbi:MAG: VWA domain-containing protein [Phototrophicaceae bacterium]
MSEAVQNERLRRWRLMLGGSPDGTGQKLSGQDAEMDAALEALYGDERGLSKGRYGQGQRRRGKGQGQGQGQGDGAGELGEGNPNGKEGSLGASNLNIARWLGDIRQYFPASVVRIMQQDAMDRLDMKQLLMEPELLELIEPDVHLVADLIALNKIMPNRTKETARIVVQKVVDELQKRLRNPLQQAILGSLNRAERNLNPRLREINWSQTIKKNLKHYQVEEETIIPETMIGYGKRRSAMKDIILCVDQSGSMASSVVYSSIFGAVMASVRAVKTHMIVFDTSVVDLTENLDDPVELLFGTQLGGGTDINRALAYCEGLIQRPRDTVLVLISDLYEGGRQDEMLRRAASIVASGVQVVALLALSDDGAPSYSPAIALAMKELGVPAFACTPDMFPDLMAAAINREDMGQWAARNQIVTAG